MGSIPLNAMRGMQLIDEGHLQRGIETMLPVALKNAAKALRYDSEGVNTLRGDALVDDVSTYESIIQFSGFTPARVSDQYKVNNSVKNYEHHILTRRSRLLAAFAMARASGDSTKKIINDMRQFSKKYPGLKIDAKTIRRSMKARARYSQRSQHGINVNKKLGDYLSKYD